MNSLIPQNELCNTILRLRTTTSLGPENSLSSSNQPENIKILFNDLSFNQYSKDELNKICDEVKADKTDSFANILLKHQFTFPFRLDLIKNIENYTKYTSPQNIYLIQLYSYLTVCVLNSQNNYKEKILVEELLKTFMNTIQSTYISSNKKLRTIFVSSFVHLFREYLKTEQMNQLFAFNVFCSFFSNNEKYSFPVESFALFVDLAKAILDQNDLLNRLIIFTDDFIQKYPKTYPKEIAQAFVLTISPVATSLDALLFVGHVSPFVGIDLMLSCLPIFPNSIISEIEAYEPLSSYQNICHTAIDTVVKLPENNSFSSTLCLVNWRTFEEPIDLITTRVSFPKVMNIEDFIKPSVLTKLSCLLDIMSEEPKIISSIFNLFQNCLCSTSKTQFSLDIAAAFLYIIIKAKELKKEYFSSLPTKLLLNRIIFDPSITIFDRISGENQEVFNTINTLRSIVFDMFLENGASSLNSIFYEIMCHPLLFAEFVYRFVESNNKVIIGRPEVIVLSQMFMYSMTFYQHFDKITQRELNAVNIARTSIFFYFDKIFENKEILLLYFQDPFFIDTYLSLVFEFYPRQIVLTHLSNYLACQESINNKECVKKINQLIEITCESLDDKLMLSLCSEFLKTIDNAISNCRLMAFYFEPLVGPLCRGIVKLSQKDEKSTNFLEEIVTFMSMTSEFHKITVPEIAAIQTALVYAFGDEPPQNLFMKVVNLIAGQKLSAIHPSFHIQQPKALKLLLTIYSRSKLLLEMFNFVAKLCQSSTKNCIEAHNGEVDSFLIDKLYKWRNDPTVSINLVASAYSLLMLISSTIGSVSVVQQFITLFSPIHSRYIPHYQCLALKSLNNMLLSAKKKPSSCLPLREPCTFEFDGLKSEQLEKGFSVTFWLFSVPNDDKYKAQIFSLRDVKGQRITLYLQASTIFVIIDSILINSSQKKQWSGKSSFKLNDSVWNLITFTVENDVLAKTTHISFTLNDGSFSEYKISTFQFSMGAVYGQVGGFSCNTTDTPSLLGSIGTFCSLNHSQINKIYQLGPINSNTRNFAILSYKPMFYFVADEKNGQIFLNNILMNNINLNDDMIRLMKESIPSTLPSSFSTILVKKCNICILLPLIAQWNLTYENGSIIPNLPELTFDVLENSLALSTEAQNQFAVSNGFKILLHLLLSSDPKFINFNSYSRFFTIFENINDEKCKEQMFTYILMNAELWIKADPENHLLILRHWARVLAPTFLDFVTKKRPLSWILTVLRKYYWYTQSEENTISIHKDRTQINVEECRSYLIQIAFLQSCSRISDNDFRCLLSHILTCSDYKQNEDLLNFLKGLIINNIQLSSNINVESLKLLSMIQYLFNSQNENLICSTLETIVLAHRNNLIQEFTLISHLDIILHQLSSSFVSKTLLSKLIDITRTSSPEIFPICSWMAMNIGNSGMREMLTNLKPNKKYETNEYWALWAVVALYKADEKLQRFIARYLIKCTSNFPQLFATCEIIGRSLNEDTTAIRKIIVIEYGKLLLRDDYQSDINDSINYFSLIRHFLFFHTEVQQNSAIEEIYNQSPFKLENKSFIKTACTPTKKLPVPVSPKKSPRKERKRKARHSIRSNSIIDSTGYSSVVTEQAISFINPAHEYISNIEENKNCDKHNSKNTPNIIQSYRNKRTSMLTLGHATFTNSKKVARDTKIISMTPTELDNKIRAIATDEISFIFGLRLNNKIEWVDIETARQALSVFKKNPDTRVADTILLICSFLAHYSQNEVRNIIPLLNQHCTNLGGAFSFFAHHCSLLGMNINIKSNTSIESQSFSYLQKINGFADKIVSASPLRFLKHFLKFETANSAYALDIYGMINESIVGLSSNMIAEYTDQCGYLLDSSSKLWSQHWHHMTINRAPWHKSLSSMHEVHFKRDFTICSNLCPSKICRNYNFDVHMKASLVREFGNVSNAQKFIDDYKSELAAQYKENNPLSLFDIVEDKEISQEILRNQRYSIEPSLINKNHNTDANQLESSSSNHRIPQCIVELPCEFIKARRVSVGTFALLTDSIILTKSEKKTVVIQINNVLNVFLRTRFHHPTAIEIFTQLGKSYFINFPNIKALPILKSFRTINFPRNVNIQNCDFKTYFQNSKITTDWAHRKMSNFEYLMKLNTMSGRSFNDPSQYPILPWVISDYESDTCDFSNPDFFRDLTKPIGATNEERLNQLIEKWKQFDHMGMESYLYSSGFVCPLSVYLWLIRQEPFTSLHIEMQSGRFDHAARLFSSIKNAYTISTHHQNDFRELIPEFYSSPEFLLNVNKFDLGKMNGKKIDDVELPNWASNPYEFVYLMRKALESEYVSENIQSWIDLIWGDKQRGEKANQANNVFMKEMYDDIWTPENLSDPSTRAQIEAILCHVGQIPPQLFDKPHPKRSPFQKPICLINKPVTFEMPTSKLISSSISSTFMSMKKSVYITAIDLSGQLIEVSIPLTSLVVKPQEKKRKGLKLRKANSESNMFYASKNQTLQNHNQPLSQEFIISSQVSKMCQTARKDVYCQLTKHQFGLVSANGYDVNIANTNDGTCSSYIHHRSEISGIASDCSGWIAIADKDSNLSVYQRNEIKYTIQTFTKSISCVAMNFGFKQIVFGTSDSSLIFCSMTDKSIVRVVDLEDNFQPIHIVITKSWGFVVVYMTKIDEGNLSHHLSLFSINGDLIKTAEIDRQVDRMVTYKSSDGFDYIVVADSSSNLFTFEAFYLNINTKAPFHVSKSNISSFFYIQEEGLAVQVGQEGSITFIPFE